jgi:broad specificity phosphatase PhoE
MDLYIVRHGQSVGNLGASDPDPALTDLGHEQGRLTGLSLAGLEIPNASPRPHKGPVTRLISSPI